MTIASLPHLAQATPRTVLDWGRIESNADLILPLVILVALDVFVRAIIRLDTRELPRLVGWTLTALRMATLMSADAIGLAGDVGSIEVGKLADLQVLDENPLDELENTTTIDFVMKNGRLYEADTLTEVWPRRRPLPTQWWWRLEPPNTRQGGLIGQPQ